MRSQNVADFMLHRLREWDVETIYAYPGEGINPLLAAWNPNDGPRFVQSRHEEMSAFQAVGHAKFTGRPGVCMATSGAGAIHLLNGLYDAKLDHAPVVAIVGQADRSAMGGAFQQEVDLHALFQDVTDGQVQTVTVPEQLPNVLDRAMRTAITRSCPAVLVVHADVQALDHSQPGQDPGVAPSSSDITPATAMPDPEGVQRAAAILNAGHRVAILAGAGARGATVELTEVAEVLGAGVAKALLGKDVLPDTLPYVTGPIGLLGSKPSWTLMSECDTLLTIGSNLPYSQFLPEWGQARAVPAPPAAMICSRSSMSTATPSLTVFASVRFFSCVKATKEGSRSSAKTKSLSAMPLLTWR
jgi:pyruvate dehydrogenase (quinone)